MAMVAIDFVTEDLEAVKQYFRYELKGELVKIIIAENPEGNKYQSHFEFDVFSNMGEDEPYAPVRGYYRLFSDMKLKKLIGEFEIGTKIRA